MNERTFRASQAHKLEDPERLNSLPPAQVMASLGLRPGMVVADVGAGTGYFAIPFAREVDRVFAVDFQPEMLDLLRQKLDVTGAPGNVELVAGSAVETGLKDGSCDLVFLANIWHELDDHAAVLREARRVLRGTGRVAVLDWRADVERPPGPPLDHRITMEAAASTLKDEGWNLQGSETIGVYSYMVVGGFS